MLILDAGPLYAILDPDDAHHTASRQLVEYYPGLLVVPTLVVSEVTYMAGKWLGTETELAFLEEIVDGAYSVQPVVTDDWPRIRELVAQYRDFPLGTVDASVLACAERLGAREIATTDRRHFTAVRPKHVDALTLLP